MEIRRKTADNNREYSKTATPENDWGLVNYSTYKTDFGKSYSYSDGETSAFDGDFIDWAVNMENGWFTMTKDSWVYMLYTREDAESLWKFTTFPVKNGEGTKDLKGLILLPDGTSPAAFDEINDIDDLDKFNAVFFPISGDRHGNNLWNVDEQVYYWTSTYKDCEHDQCWRVSLNWSGEEPEIEIIKQDRKFGRTVRLVRFADEEDDEIDSFTQELW
ncbi:MAG: hypothetical protein Q4F69_06765 [Bacteroidia bacterium]|nr:hypothetical protein [Bacteroidia bacterium]